jgi:hypothetical protein
MATQEMILKLSFNDEGTFEGLEEINQELQTVNNTTEQLEKSTKTLAQQYKALKKEQDQYDPGTEKFQKLSAQMGELKDRMNDAADAVKGNTGPAIEGARASFGMLGEQLMNLDFEGVSQSLNLVSGNLARLKPQDFSNGLKSIGTAGVNAFKAIGKAIMANPLLAVAGILVAIAMNFDKVIKLVPALEKGLTGINEEERENLRILNAKASVSQKTLENFDKQTNALRLQGKSEREILVLRMQHTKASLQDRKNILAQLELQAKTQIETAKRNHDILEGIMKFLNAPIHALLTAVDYVAAAVGKESNLAGSFNNFLTNLIFDPTEVEAELNKTIEENRSAIATMEQDYNGMELEIQRIDREAAKSKNEKSKAAKEKRDQEAEDERKRIEDAAAQAEKEMADYEKSKMAAIDLEKFEANEKYAIQKKALEDAGRSKEELQKLEQQHTTILADIDTKYRNEKWLKDEEIRKAEIEKADEQFALLQKLQSTAQENEINEVVLAGEKMLESLGMTAENEIIVAEDTAAKIAAITKKYADEEAKAIEEAEKKKQEARMANIQSNFEMASLALDALSSLNEAATKGDEASQRKAFERNKMIQKAQATIAMASGIVQQLAVPQDQLTGMNFVKAAAVAAAGVANIVKINQTQFGGSTPSPNPGNLTAPTGGANAPAVDFSGANMQVNAPGSTETYVLAGNVANALEARQKIIDQSHL